MSSDKNERKIVMKAESQSMVSSETAVELPQAQWQEILLETDQRMERMVSLFRENGGEQGGDALAKAYEFAKAAHSHQKRLSGEPYITHPVAVAEIMMEIEADEESVMAALLHDTVEDTTATIEIIAEVFGASVARLVNGVTKLEKLRFTSKVEQQAENFRKMFMAMADDIRVVLIKLADRLHNMRTLIAKDSERAVLIAQETLDIYAPLAHRLGIYRIKWELEDLSLRYIDPDAYYALVAGVQQKRADREEYMKGIMEKIKAGVMEVGITCEIEGRPKHFYSIYRKMKTQHKTLDTIFDLFATRVLVPHYNDCYTVIGVVHALFKPLPGRFKDYVSNPKANQYQSVHTTVVGPHNIPFEVQTRTFAMHRIAEYGIAAHWRYKTGAATNKDDVFWNERLQWLRQLLDWQKDMTSADEYMESLKNGLVEEEIYVFTPRGDVIILPPESNAIDFAYQIHSGVGNSMLGAKVNGQTVPIDRELQNGDIVEIVTSERVVGPSRDWLNKAKSNSAKAKIKAWFRRDTRDVNVIEGKNSVEHELNLMNFPPKTVMTKDVIAAVLGKISHHSLDDTLASIGYGSMTAKRFATKLRDEFLRQSPPDLRAKYGYIINSKGVVRYAPDAFIKTGEADSNNIRSHSSTKKKTVRNCGVDVIGVSNCLVRLSRCCSPVVGDDIIGYATKGKGVTVHRRSCINMQHIIENFDASPLDAERAARLMEVEWIDRASTVSQVELKIIAHDRRHLLADISGIIAEEQVPIRSSSSFASKNISAVIQMTIEVADGATLERLCNRIEAVAGVIGVKRGL